MSVIGTGNLGCAVARGLLAAGHQVTVFNRTRAKAEPLSSLGACLASTAAEAICASQYTIVVLYDGRSARNVLLSEDVQAVLRDKAIVSAVSMEPGEIASLATDVGRHGGRLSEVMVASYPDAVQRRCGEFILAAQEQDAEDWKRILADLGPKVHDVGPVGNASKVQSSLMLPHLFVRVAIAYALAAFERQNLPVPLLRSLLSDNPSIALPYADVMISEMLQRGYGCDSYTVDMTVPQIEQAIDLVRDSISTPT